MSRSHTFSEKLSARPTLRSAKGFTIVELMVASTVFAVILLIVAGTIVRFTNTFQKGVIDGNTQNVTRSIADTISNAVKYGEKVEKQGLGYCVGSTMYAFTPKIQYDGSDTKYALREIRGAGAGCSITLDPGFDPAAQGQELIGTDMRLSHFSISPLPCEDVCTVSVIVAYGGNDLIENWDKNYDPDDPGTHPKCFSRAGSQFCSVRELSVTIKPWL